MANCSSIIYVFRNTQKELSCPKGPENKTIKIAMKGGTWKLPSVVTCCRNYKAVRLNVGIVGYVHVHILHVAITRFLNDSKQFSVFC